MSLSKPTHPIRDEDLYLLPLIKLITCVGRDLMFRVFTYGCPNKDPNKNLKDYLLQDVGMTAATFKKYFNKTQVDQIITSPACDQFDVPLLFLAIKVACDHNIADKDSSEWFTQDYSKLEYLLKLLKDERNELLHNLPMRTKAELTPKIEELRSLLMKIIEQTSDRFGVDPILRQQYLTELNYHVDQVRDQPLTETEILQYKTLWLREYIENTLKESGAAELKEVLTKLDYINPLSFMDGYDTLINLQVVFFQLLIEHQDRFNKKTTVDLNQILQVGECATAEQSSLILVRGEAGAGKSILTKWMMLQWAKNDVQMPGLAEYNLVIPLECQNHHFDSLTKLLRSLLPNTSPKLGEDIITYIHNLKILFILDGLDQLNTASHKVVDEIMQLSKTKQHTVLCTSRPKKAKEFLYTVPDQYQKCIFDIVGIPPAEQAGFVSRYHDHLIHLGKSVQSTDRLVQFVNKSDHLQGLFKCPLILLLVVYLWACQPDRLNESTTDTELYNLLYQMLEERMKQRLLTRARANNINVDDIDGMFRRFIQYFSLEALVSLSQGPGILHSTSQERLKSQLAHDDVVHFQELASTYLAYRIVEKSAVNEGQLCFPSDDCHNYFAAKGLLYAITDIHQYSTLKLNVMGPTETSDLQQDYEENVSNDVIITHVLAMVDITKYTKILKHLVQLFNEEEDELDNNEAWEVVQLLKDSGITTREAWLDFLAEVKCVQQMSNIIASIYFSSEKELVIKCSSVAGMSSLMPHLSPYLVTLDLPGDLDDVLHLNLLLEIIAQKKCNVEVKCWRNFTDPNIKDVNDPTLQCLLHHDARCRVKGVAEHLYDFSEEKESSDVGECETPAVQTSGQLMSTATVTLLQQPGSSQDTSVTSEINSEAADATDKMKCLIDKELDLVSDEGGVKKYLVRTKVESTDEDTAKVLSYGDANEKETKCLLLLGETGAGKTTFVNAVFNHLYNINFEDSFRVCVEDQRTEDRTFTESQTDFITVFKFHHKEGMRYDSNFVIIDTPGLADTRGIEHQNRIMKDLEEFFLSDHGIDDLHCLGLTTNATINRRSLYQKEIVDNIMSLLGKHIPDITNILATHATEKAKVGQVLESAGVKFNKIYGFDNHVVFAPNKLGEDVQERELKMLELRWENTLQQFKLFFSDLLEAKPVSVSILREKKRLDISQRSLEVSVTNLVMQWSTSENLKKDITDYEVLRENSRDYNQEKEVPKKIRLHTGRSHAHNCTKCDQTCKFCTAHAPFEKMVKDNAVETHKRHGAFGGLVGGVRGISRGVRTINKKQCFFHDEPCAQCGHARSEHCEEKESIKSTIIKVAFVNEFMKTQFDETELKIKETTDKINAVRLEISPAKEEVATQFLNMIVCFKRVQNLSPASEMMAAQDIMDQVTPEVEQESDQSDRATKILLGLKETINLFDTCGVDEVFVECDSVATILNNIVGN